MKDGEYFQLLKDNTAGTVHFFRFSVVKKEDFRYTEGKWTPKQIFQHIIDTERVLCYRALVAARGDKKTLLQNMEQDEYNASVDVSNKTLEELIDEFKTVRKSTTSLLASLSEAESMKCAKAEMDGQIFPISARAVGYIVIGHILHHTNTIKEKYL
ncbi:MAG: DinB family protein [Ignavibacteria bacterium]|nr:DinB family protein [Ignavibacteria bacterium]